MSRKRTRQEFSSEENDENISNSKKKNLDTAKSMDINAVENESSNLKANNNKKKVKAVS